VDFIWVEHSNPRGRASTDRTNRARLPSLCVPIGAKAQDSGGCIAPEGKKLRPEGKGSS